MTDDKNKDLGPFDDEYFDDEDLNSDQPKVSDEYFDDEKLDMDDSDLPDDVPAVSINKKKNVILFLIILLILLFFGYQFFKGDPRKQEKQVAKTEAEEMSDAFREKSNVPALSDDMQILANKSPVKEREKDSALNDLVVAPPPPPLIEPSSQFTSSGLGLPTTVGLPPIGSPTGSSNTPGGLTGVFLGSTSSKAGGAGRNSQGNSGAPSLPSLGGELYGTSGGNYGAGNLIGGGAIVSEDYKARIQAEMFIQQASDTEFVRKRNASDQGLVQNGSSSEYGLDTGYNLTISGASRSGATYVGNLKNIILQGKVIDAVLETAINTDLPDGTLRGIVSRDVYAEKGNRVLIPKGSRLIGSYKTDVKFGQARVFIVWSRVIRPDGIDAVLDSNATDLLGRRGVYGKLDNRFLEIFGSSILISSISIAFAIAATEIANPPDSQTSTTGNSVVEDTDPETEAIRSAVESLGSDVGSIAEELLVNKPRITVDQGTRIKIFVNKDIHFPDSFKNEEDGVRIIQ